MGKLETTWTRKKPSFIIRFICLSLVGTAVAFIMYNTANITDIMPILTTTTVTIVFVIICFLEIYGHLKANYIIKEDETVTQTEALYDHFLVTIRDCNRDIIYVNDKFPDTTGYSKEELVGQSSSVYWADREDALLHEVHTATSNGKKWFGEVQLKTKKRITPFPINRLPVPILRQYKEI